MGAIAAFLSRRAPPDRALVEGMLAAAPHRGGSYRTEILGQVALAVGNDPEWRTASLAREDGLLAAFHGSLDNAAELEADLRGSGVLAEHPNSPAAVLARGFAVWGEDVAGRFRGSFAAVVTDGVRAWLFRDHFGTRPFYFHDAPTGFYAATEAKQVLAGAPVSREPDLDYLHSLLFGSVDRATSFRGVERIPERFVAAVGPEPGLSLRRFWDPDALVEAGRLGPDDAVEGTAHALDRAVRRMLTGRDVLLLSGGLDSPSLAAFAARANPSPHPVQALTAVYPDHPSVDEREWTGLAARHTGMPLHCYVARAGSLDEVERWTSLVEGPIPALSIPESVEAYVEARALGGRTVLTGEIAEMLFEARYHLLDHLIWKGKLGAAGQLVRQRLTGRRAVRRVARELILAVTPPDLLPRRVRPPDHPRAIGLPEWVDSDMLVAYAKDPPFWRTPPRERWSRVQTSPFLGPGIGFEADEICAAYCGVEVRRPFTDVDLWEFVLGIPADAKFPGRATKPLLRAAMRGILPDELIDRKDKTYFDEFHLATADYETLKRFLVGAPNWVQGIDYPLLEQRIEGGRMQMYELLWARNLVRIHAFLRQW